MPPSIPAPAPAPVPPPPRPVRTLPAQAALDSEEGERAGVTTRIALAATAVFGQLWALSVGLDRYLLGYDGQAWLLFGFSAISFLVVLAVTLVHPAPRRDRIGRGRASTQSSGLYRPDPATTAQAPAAGSSSTAAAASPGWPSVR